MLQGQCRAIHQSSPLNNFALFVLTETAAGFAEAPFRSRATLSSLLVCRTEEKERGDNMTWCISFSAERTSKWEKANELDRAMFSTVLDSKNNSRGEIRNIPLEFHLNLWIWIWSLKCILMCPINILMKQNILTIVSLMIISSFVLLMSQKIWKLNLSSGMTLCLRTSN